PRRVATSVMSRPICFTRIGRPGWLLILPITHPLRRVGHELKFSFQTLSLHGQFANSTAPRAGRASFGRRNGRTSGPAFFVGGRGAVRATPRNGAYLPTRQQPRRLCRRPLRYAQHFRLYEGAILFRSGPSVEGPSRPH